MKHMNPLGLLAAAFLLSTGTLPVGAAEQYDTGNAGVQESDTAIPRMQKRDRRAQGTKEAGLVKCQDSAKCRQKNPNWQELQGATKPLLVDPATGMPPKK